MNTIRSTWYGWATLCVAGGGAYYFAKKQINADRAERYNKERQKQERLRRLEATNTDYSDNAVQRSKKKSSTNSNNGPHDTKGLDHAGSPSHEASEDAAPVEHAPTTPEQRVREKSKYEAAEPFRSKKGDRFS